jgi:hypothetical protein
MARRNDNAPHDNLALDVMDARAAGLSYGQYKALHPRTAAANEPRLAPPPKSQSRRNVVVVSCKTCGQLFEANQKNKAYCSPACADEGNRRRNRELVRRRKAEKKAQKGEKA